MDLINIKDFQKIDIRIGVVTEASEVEGSDKLIRQVVDFGEELGTKIIFSGIKKWYQPEEMVGKHLPYVVNLEPRKMPSYAKETDDGTVLSSTHKEGYTQEESQGMLVAASPKDEEGHEMASLFEVSDKVPAGTKVV